ncbi:MAG: hypothetical protein GY863_08775 [bacterium]|nr:hypothetical protein [bacterium]
MNEPYTQDTQRDLTGEQNIDYLIINKLQLLFLSILSIGFIGYFIFRMHWTGIIYGHMGAIGIMGFYGCLAGFIAARKGHDYRKAFKMGFFIPIILGVISAFWLADGGGRGLPITCGGWAALASGILIAVYYSIRRSKVQT